MAASSLLRAMFLLWALVDVDNPELYKGGNKLLLWCDKSVDFFKLMGLGPVELDWRIGENSELFLLRAMTVHKSGSLRVSGTAHLVIDKKVLKEDIQ